MLVQDHTLSYQISVSKTMLILLNVASFALPQITRLQLVIWTTRVLLELGQLNPDLSHYKILYREFNKHIRGYFRQQVKS